MTGTVFDIGYRNYTGRREGRGRGRRAIYKDGVRTALGLGRGGRAENLPWVFISVMSPIPLVLALGAGAAQRLRGPGSGQRAHLPSPNHFFRVASVILF